MSERPLRVGFNARLLVDPRIRGWNRYTIDLLAELPAQGVRPILYARGPIAGAHLERLPPDACEVREFAGSRLLDWEHRLLPRALRDDGVDLFHSPFNFGIPWSCPCPTVLTLHDAIDYVYYRDRQSLAQRFAPAALRFLALHWSSRVRADRIITVSRHAKGDIVRRLGVRPDRIEVIHEAADPAFLRPVTPEDRSRARARHDLPDRYFFYVGGWEGRKNIPFLLDAFAAAALDDVQLVLAGGKADQRAAILERAERLGIATRLRLLEWVEDEDLPALYAEAIAFVYPSEYEGFGLQLCESMAVGTPALASRASCLPEILGAGGETFGLETTDEAAELMRRTARDRVYREELARRASARSADFSWSAAARETAALYRSLLERSR
jgi:glycosyltransferase involved in cell wall biosynthesis